MNPRIRHGGLLRPEKLEEAEAIRASAYRGQPISQTRKEKGAVALDLGPLRPPVGKHRSAWGDKETGA